MFGASDLGAALRRYAEFSKALPACPPVNIDVLGEHVRVSAELTANEPADEVVIDGMLIAGHRPDGLGDREALAATPGRDALRET